MLGTAHLRSRAEARGQVEERVRAEQQKNLDVLRANLDATRKAGEKLSLQESTEGSAPGLHPEQVGSGRVLGSCSDYLVVGPASGAGAYASASIDPSCASFTISAYAAVNGVGGSITSSYYRNLTASIGGSENCVSQAYAQANGWTHTLTYPFCT